MTALPQTTPDDPRLLLLSPKDNVFVAREPLDMGESVSIGGVLRVLAQAIMRGHKVARVTIAPGDKVFKYGAPIGSATHDIAPGEHVHVHNVKSDYTPTHLIDIQTVAKK